MPIALGSGQSVPANGAIVQHGRLILAAKYRWKRDARRTSVVTISRPRQEIIKEC